jgi:hypothetical protein
MLDLSVIKARHKATTPGPWEVMGVSGHVLGNDLNTARKLRTAHHQWTHNTTPENAAFIAQAHADVPAMAAEIEKLRAWCAAFRDAAFDVLDSAHPDTEGLSYLREVMDDEEPGETLCSEIGRLRKDLADARAALAQ